MSCRSCQERRAKLRSALVERKIAEAARQAALGLLEAAGLKKGEGDGLDRR